MPLATALVTGNDPDPRIAEEAIERALAKAGLTHANSVLLFLTPEFARHALQAVTAAARRARCTQVAGGIASGVLTESGWAMDRPAAAAMVLGGGLSLTAPASGDKPILSYAGAGIPPERQTPGRRFGGVFDSSVAGGEANAGSVVWQQCRLAENNVCSVQIQGVDIAIGVSRGWRKLGAPRAVGRVKGYDLESIGTRPALDSLAEALPAAWRSEPARHLHHLAALVFDTIDEANYRTVSIVAANPDHSLTLAERIDAGQRLAWAIREPDDAEADMRRTLDRLAEALAAPPAGALMFSCIGRGPCFYGGKDRDLDALTGRFPGLPVIGAYGTGQIAPLTSAGNGQFQNAVVTALISPQPETSHVQSLP